MTASSNSSRRTHWHALAPGGILTLDHARGTLVSVERGCVWITLEGDPRDIVLLPGTRFEIDRQGKSIIAAEEESCVRLVDARPGRVAAWTAALKEWLENVRPRTLPYF